MRSLCPTDLEKVGAYILRTQTQIRWDTASLTNPLLAASLHETCPNLRRGQGQQVIAMLLQEHRTAGNPYQS